MLNVVFMYSPEDTRQAAQIKAQFNSLVAAGLLQVNDYDSVLPGQKHQATKIQHILEADCLVILISPDFLAECPITVEILDLLKQAGKHMMLFLLRTTLVQYSMFKGRMLSNDIPLSELTKNKRDAVINREINRLCERFGL